jgi:hypothetical protein
MKKNFIRLLTIMALASSISAFTLSETPRKAENTNDRKTPCETAPAPAAAQPNDSTEKSRQKFIEEQEKQWLKDTRNNDAG